MEQIQPYVRTPIKLEDGGQLFWLSRPPTSAIMMMIGVQNEHETYPFCRYETQDSSNGKISVVSMEAGSGRPVT